MTNGRDRRKERRERRQDRRQERRRDRRLRLLKKIVDNLCEAIQELLDGSGIDIDWQPLRSTIVITIDGILTLTLVYSIEFHDDPDEPDESQAELPKV